MRRLTKRIAKKQVARYFDLKRTFVRRRHQSIEGLPLFGIRYFLGPLGMAIYRLFNRLFKVQYRCVFRHHAIEDIAPKAACRYFQTVNRLYGIM